MLSRGSGEGWHHEMIKVSRGRCLHSNWPSSHRHSFSLLNVAYCTLHTDTDTPRYRFHSGPIRVFKKISREKILMRQDRAVVVVLVSKQLASRLRGRPRIWLMRIPLENWKYLDSLIILKAKQSKKHTNLQFRLSRRWNLAFKHSFCSTPLQEALR